MKLLAIDTSSEACSAALQIATDITERHHVEARAHTRILVPMIRELLDAAGLCVADLDAIVLGNGPGSFIGMRIGASVAQGLAFGAGLLLVPLSSLAALAAEVIAEEQAQKVVVAQDARMNEVYVGRFTAAEGNAPLAEEEERLLPAHAAAGLAGAGWVAAGTAWTRYPALAAANAASIARVSERRYPRARYLLAPGARALRGGLAVRPEQLEPAYLRHAMAASTADPAL